MLKLLIDRFGLTEDFFEVYFERYKHSMLFVDEIIAQKNRGFKDEFYISYLAINEIFSALRDEVRSILLFSKGIPISSWRDPRNNPNIDAKDYELMYKNGLNSFDELFEKKSIFFIPEQSPEDDPNYLEIYSSILFLIKETKTQDVTLLTTAILNRADYFVTKDERLIKSAKKIINERYGLGIIKPIEAICIIKEKKVKNE